MHTLRCSSLAPRVTCQTALAWGTKKCARGHLPQCGVQGRGQNLANARQWALPCPQWVCVPLAARGAGGDELREMGRKTAEEVCMGRCSQKTVDSVLCAYRISQKPRASMSSLDVRDGEEGPSLLCTFPCLWNIAPHACIPLESKERRQLKPKPVFWAGAHLAWVTPALIPQLPRLCPGRGLASAYTVFPFR